MVQCMLADSGFPSSIWGELFMAAVCFKNRTPHKALKRKTLFKMLHGEEADTSHLRVIGARTFVHIEDARKLDAATWKGEVFGYSEEKKSYRVWNPKTHRVTFIETSPHLLPSPSQLSSLRDLVPPSWDLNDDTLENDSISYDDILRDARGYTGVLNFTSIIPANHENVSDVSADPQVQGLVDQIRDQPHRSSKEAFIGGSITTEWRGGVGRNRRTFAGPCAGCSEKGVRFTQQQDSSVQRRHAAYFR